MNDDATVRVPDARASSSAPRNGMACPMCDYDLRGLVEPRCPECGYRFTWEELTDLARGPHPFLFENHPERNAWSFRRTLVAGLRPATFWQTLFPTQRSRPLRLAAYYGIVVLVWLLLVVAQAVRSTIAASNRAARDRVAMVAHFPTYPQFYQQAMIARYGSFEAYNEWRSPRFPHGSYWFRLRRDHLVRNTMLFSLPWLLWPWLTLAVLVTFQASMRRSRVRFIHVLRCVIYAGDVAVWAAVVMFGLILFDIRRNGLGGTPWNIAPMGPTFVWSLAVLLPVTAYRLAAAYKHYLHFPHPWATAVAVQLILLLILATFALHQEWYLAWYR
jgi:hypothetical protein